MNARMAKKWAARWSARSLSLPLTLAHARRSFYAIPDVKHQRKCLVEQMTELGVSKRVGSYITRNWFPPR